MNGYNDREDYTEARMRYIILTEREAGKSIINTTVHFRFQTKIPCVDPLGLETVRSGDCLSHCVQNEIQTKEFFY